MILPARPIDDDARVAALCALEILDTGAEQEFDAIVRLASEVCGCPVALVSLVDESRQWFKARVGFDATETPRDLAYCAHAIHGDQTMVVPNAADDPRFSDHPLRLGEPHAEFYAGVPLHTGSGHKVGTLCVIDHVPRTLSAAQQTALEALAAQVVRLLELRRAAVQQRKVLATWHERDEVFRKHLASRPPDASRRAWSRASVVVAMVLCLATVTSTLWVRQTLASAERGRLNQAALRVGHFFAERSRAYDEILRGTRALFRARDEVTRKEFHDYAEALSLTDKHRGLIALGFTERVQSKDLSVWLEGVRRELPELVVTSSGRAATLSIAKFLEPPSANVAVLGYDLQGDPVRARALELAERTRSLTVTDPVRLLQDGSRGYVVYLPVPSAAGAGYPVMGWVSGAVRTRDLVAGIEQAAGPDIEVHIADADGTSLIGEARAEDEHSAHATLPFANRALRLGVRATPARIARGTLEVWGAGLLGLAVTVLSFSLTISMRRTEARSQRLAADMTKALRSSERELRAIIEGTTDFVVTFSADGHLLLTNSAFRSMLEYTAEELEALTITQIVHPDARAELARALAQDAVDSMSFVATAFRTRKGVFVEVEGALSQVVIGGRVVRRGIFRDVTERKRAEGALVRANQALEKLARSDGLTGLANRRAFDASLSEAMERARSQRTKLALVLLDVDHFKAYNDRYGHQSGDECLRDVAQCLSAVARRSGELAARYGGEEFALVLPGADRAAALERAEHARSRIADLKREHQHHPLGIVTVSLGVATFDPLTMRDSHDLIATADAALYRAKARGRNRVEEDEPAEPSARAS